jgi:hypothetical protein
MSQVSYQSSSNRPLRIAIIILQVFITFTAIQGAIFVVPTIPMEWLHHGIFAPFSSPLIPALALGIGCGGSALITGLLVIIKHRFAALATIIAGIIMILFEFVEITIVGFTATQMPDQPAPNILHYPGFTGNLAWHSITKYYVSKIKSRFENQRLPITVNKTRYPSVSRIDISCSISVWFDIPRVVQLVSGQSGR